MKKLEPSHEHILETGVEIALNLTDAQKEAIYTGDHLDTTSKVRQAAKLLEEYVVQESRGSTVPYDSLNADWIGTCERISRHIAEGKPVTKETIPALLDRYQTGGKKS